MSEFIDEWLKLATAPERDTKSDPVLSEEHTPYLYNKFIDLLFVGLSDNTVRLLPSPTAYPLLTTYHILVPAIGT